MATKLPRNVPLVHSWAALLPYSVPMYIDIFSMEVRSISPSLPLLPELIVKI
jgi:hypothetical protein